MERILKVRIILDTEEDIFRDIEIELNAPLTHLHLATLDAFNWNDANEMASYYKSNESWDKGDEFPLMSMGPEFPSMESATVMDLLPEVTSKGVYVYDYLRMWCFYLEPVSIGDAEDGAAYPRLTLEFGQTPHPLSREPEGLDDLALMAEMLGEEVPGGSKRFESTGDPELDAYLQGDDEDENDQGGMENIDDYDEYY